jgi:NitT/TauT family transport system ATP-binding protein
MPLLAMDGLTLRYSGAPHPVLERFSLHLRPGERLAILGASGCGKTSLLHLVAGFLRPEEGDVVLHGKRVRGAHDVCGMMFQHPTHFAWMTTLQNVVTGPLLALRSRHAPWRRFSRAYREERAAILESGRDILKEFGIAAAHHGKYPRELSGGMQRRMELAQMLMADSSIVLFDEPLSALDPVLRVRLRRWLRDVLIERKLTAIMVSHDIEDALAFATRVIVMGGSPAAIFHEQSIDQDQLADERYVAAVGRTLEDVLARQV